VFDIGFFELLLIAIVGLLVIGPERLPETVRSIALWIGRIKRSVRQTRDQIEQQIGADDIRRQLHNEEVMQRLAEAEQSLNEATSFDSLEHNPVVRQAHHEREPDGIHHERESNEARHEQGSSTSAHPEPVEGQLKVSALAEGPGTAAADKGNKNP